MHFWHLNTVISTFVSLLNESLIDVLLLGAFQDVEETQVDSVRLFHDDVQQRLSGFDWTISQRLNWLQLFECQRVSLIRYVRPTESSTPSTANEVLRLRKPRVKKHTVKMKHKDHLIASHLMVSIEQSVGGVYGQTTFF